MQASERRLVLAYNNRKSFAITNVIRHQSFHFSSSQAQKIEGNNIPRHKVKIQRSQFQFHCHDSETPKKPRSLKIHMQEDELKSKDEEEEEEESD